LTRRALLARALPLLAAGDHIGNAVDPERGLSARCDLIGDIQEQLQAAVPR
jgi:hypothetical protein